MMKNLSWIGFHYFKHEFSKKSLEKCQNVKVIPLVDSPFLKSCNVNHLTFLSNFWLSTLKFTNHMSLFIDFQPQCYYLIYEASYLENWIGHGYFKSRLWSQKGKVSFSKGMCVYVSVLSTCVRSALTLRSSTWPSRLFHQWESTPPLNGLDSVADQH